MDDDGRAVGYAIWFETYSSVLARPTMHLEDIFVVEPARRSGGQPALRACPQARRARGCGRMDWQVLDWNSSVREFYERRDAVWMKEWLLYRLNY